jgi:APA family basic amino acid/polyamine antiporter
MSDTLARPEADEDELHRALGPWSLIALGIGAIIGAGIFVITGTAAAQHAGPAILISFIIAGVGCLFAGLCYAEMASMIPVSGSAYTYTYATMGRFLGWFIGWDLVLEYGVAASTVSVGWSGYFRSLLGDFGIHLPTAFSSAPLGFNGHAIVLTGAIINIPAIALVVLLTAFLVVGVRESARFNGAMVLVKIAVVLLVIIFGLSYIKAGNLTPFIPPNTGVSGEFGWSGIFAAAGLVFFAYIGFDAVSVSAQESINPKRDMPVGILGSLAICTVLYILMALVLTGIAPYKSLNVDHPVSLAVANVPGLAWLTWIVDLGATVGLASVVFVSLYGQSRVFYAMARDGFLPKLFREIHPRYRTPWRGTILTGAVAMVAAALLPLDILGELVSIGTLSAFVLVCISVMILRVRAPRAKRTFRTPFVWFSAPAGVVVCAAMIAKLPVDTWVRLIVWLLIGLVIFFTYGIRHAKPSKWAAEIES